MNKPMSVDEELGDAGQRSGVERDEEEVITHPFNPEDIDIDVRKVLLSHCMSRIEHNEINLATDFQRKAGLWSPLQKSRLIESLILGIPLPSFYVSSDRNGNWDVVDGLQRLTTMKEFFLGKYVDTKNNNHLGDGFMLKDLEFLDQYVGYKFLDLPRRLQRDLNEIELQFIVIKQGTPESVKRNIFKRINTGGLPLTPQEIRHALYQGKATKLLRELVESEEFLTATSSSIDDSRMAGRELILRFVAFSLRSYSSYNKKDFDNFLSDTMRLINLFPSPSEIELKSIFKNDTPLYIELSQEEITKRFYTAMKRAFKLFQEHAFRKSFPGDKYRSPINKALFEVWSVTLSTLSEHQWETLYSNSKSMLSEYRDTSSTLYNTISYGVSDPKNVAKRFSTIEVLVFKYAKA